MRPQDFWQELEEMKPTSAFTSAAWGVLAIGAIAFLVGIIRVDTLALSEKGFYVAVLALGLYAAISLQKTLRDRAEGLPISDMYLCITASVGAHWLWRYFCWLSVCTIPSYN